MPDDHLRLQGEEELWSGAPDPNAVFTAWDLFLVPLSLFWIGTAISFAVDAGSASAWFAYSPVLAVGLFLVVGRFWLKRWRNHRTSYILTATDAKMIRGNTTSSIPLTHGRLRIDVRQRRGRAPVTFYPELHPAKGTAVFREMFENTGLDFTLRPGIDIPFRFFDVPNSAGLESALVGMVDGSGDVEMRVTHAINQGRNLA